MNCWGQVAGGLSRPGARGRRLVVASRKLPGGPAVERVTWGAVVEGRGGVEGVEESFPPLSFTPRRPHAAGVGPLLQQGRLLRTDWIMYMGVFVRVCVGVCVLLCVRVWLVSVCVCVC